MQKYCPKCHILLIKLRVLPSVMLHFNSIKYSVTNTSTAKKTAGKNVHKKPLDMAGKVIVFSK